MCDSYGVAHLFNLYLKHSNMIIQKILKYDLYAETSGRDKYTRVCSLLEQSIEPETLMPKALDCHGKPVATSPRQRAVDCIKISSAKSITEMSALNEIPFSLKNFCSEAEFLKNDSSAVRRSFITAFESDQLLISHSQLQKELDDILLLKHTSPHLLCISHTFRMKLIGTYNLVGAELFSKPSIIGKYLDPNKHLYNFGEMIVV